MTGILSSTEDGMAQPASTPGHGDTPALTSAQQRLIQRHLWMSIIASVCIFVLSMAPHLGSSSIFISPSVITLCVVYDATLLVLSKRERKGASQQATQVDIPPADETPKRPPLPAVCRKPSIILSFVLALLSLAAMAANITMLALLSGSRGSWLATRIVEIIFIAGHIVILGNLGVLCTQERKRLMGNGISLGQYD